MHVRCKTSLYATFVILFVCLVASGAIAQTAQIQGQVTDTQGAVIPNADVRIINQQTGVERRTTTNRSGIYSAPFLEPGRYKVSVGMTSFKRAITDELTLNVGQVLVSNFALRVGTTSETVTVTGGAPRVNVSDASVSTVIDRQFVGNLPLNGRSIQSLILLTPGVVIANAGTDVGQFSVNGQRANANYFAVDGVSANIGFDLNQQAGTVPGLTAAGGTSSLVSIDALEEFRIQSSTYTAEFGRQPGAQVSLVTRSGGNKFHGSLFDYLRNDVLDAREYFARTCTAAGACTPIKKPALRQNQFGGTFSGPLIKNRTFFFFSYEGQRLRLPQAGSTFVPSLRLRQLANPDIAKFLNAFPRPDSTTAEETTRTACNPATDPDCSPITRTKYSGWTSYTYGISDPGSTDAASLRLDHTFSSKLALFGRYNRSNSISSQHFPNALATPSDTFASTQTITVGATSVLRPRLYNEFRFNYSRQRIGTIFRNDVFGDANPIDVLDATTGYTGSENRWALISLFYNGQSAALNLGNPSDSYQRQINVVDNFSWVKGTHQFKFGGDFRRMAPIYAPGGYKQSSLFSSENDVRSGFISSLSIQAFQGSRPLFDNYSVFGQDNWKLLPRLTLDLGLRWELNPAPGEENGRKPPTVVGIVGTDVSNATLAPPGTPFFKTFYTAFAPRFGAAYELNSAAARETVLRGGIGVFYDLGTGQVARGFTAWPFLLSVQRGRVRYPVAASEALPPAFDQFQIAVPVSGTIYAQDENLRLPYTVQWNVALEQSLGIQQTLSLSYVAAIGRRLLMTNTLNDAPAGSQANPNFSSILLTSNGPTSDYHSLQIQYKARLTSGLQALANYTWSHAIDEISDEWSAAFLARGNSNFDVRHNFSAALSYAIPSVSARSVFRHVFNGWTVDGIVRAQTGRPVNITSGFFDLPDGTLMSVRPDVVPGVPFYISDPTVPGGRRFNTAAFQKPPSLPAPNSNIPARQGNFDRNVLRELAIYQADVALGRTVSCSDRLKLKFNWEIFNLFNHPMFGSYNTSFVSSSFGVPTTTLNRSLGGLSRLYQMGGPRSMQASLKLTF